MQKLTRPIIIALATGLCGCSTMTKGEISLPSKTEALACTKIDIKRFSENRLTGGMIEIPVWNVSLENFQESFRRYGINANCESANEKYTLRIESKYDAPPSLTRNLWIAASTLTLTIVPYRDDSTTYVNITSDKGLSAQDSKRFENWASIIFFFTAYSHSSYSRRTYGISGYDLAAAVEMSSKIILEHEKSKSRSPSSKP